MIKILIVDDERDVVLLFNKKLKKELDEGDFKLDFAFSTEEAIDYMNRLEPFDIILVLSDINMPGMSGLELLRYAKNKFTDLKVIMVSAYGDDDNRARAAAYGADDFVSKPVDFNALKENLRALIK